MNAVLPHGVPVSMYVTRCHTRLRLCFQDFSGVFVSVVGMYAYFDLDIRCGLGG